MRWLNFALPKK
jgi:hypothetical protein